MAEVTKNVFTEGMVQDLSPTSTSLTFLTDALNATFVTNNGNELSLLNDMGNALVQNVSLPHGYSPVGVCEYGSIIYVLSVNPKDGRSLIGSFPSPEYILDDKDSQSIKVEDSDFFSIVNYSYYKTPEDYNNSLLSSAAIESGEFKISTIAATVTKKPTNQYALNPGDSYKIQHLDTAFPYGTVKAVLLKSDGTQQDLQDIIEEVWQFNSNKSSGELALRFDLYSVQEFLVTTKITYSKNENYPYLLTFVSDPEISEEYKGMLINIHKNSDKENTEHDIKFFSDLKVFSIYAKNDGKVTYTITPRMSWGLYELGEKTITIDYDKVGSDTKDVTVWKYYTFDETTQLQMNLDLNPSLLKEVTKVTITFYDNQGSAAIYTIDDRLGAYNGAYEINLPLNGSSNIAELTPISDKLTSPTRIDQVNTLVSENAETGEKSYKLEEVPVGQAYYHFSNRYYEKNPESGLVTTDELLDNGLTYKLLAITKEVDESGLNKVYYVDVTKSKGEYSIAEGPKFDDVLYLFGNNVGIIQGNYIYACELKVYTKPISDGLEESNPDLFPEEVWYTHYEWFWTNGVYNEYYYDSSVTNVNKQTIKLYADVATQFNLKNPRTETPQLSKDSEVIQQYKNEYGEVNISENINEVEYNINQLKSEFGILNHYNTFSAKSDNFEVSYYAGVDPIYDYEQPEIVSNDSDNITIALPEVKISGKIVSDLNKSSESISYVDDAGELKTTNKIIDGSKGFIFKGKYINYSVELEVKSTRSLSVLEPVLSLEDLDKIYGLNFQKSSCELTFSLHLVSFFDDQTYCMIHMGNGFQSLVQLNSYHKDKYKKEWNYRFITSYNSSTLEGSAHNLTNVDFAAGDNSVETWGQNLKTKHPKIFWMFNIIADPCMQSITIRDCNDYSGNSDAYNYYGMCPGKRSAKVADRARLPEWGCIIGMRDVKGNVHLTNTFTKRNSIVPNHGDADATVNLLCSMLLQLYKKRSTVNATAKRFTYHETQEYQSTQNVISVVKPKNNTAFLVFGIDFNNPNQIFNVLNKRFGDDQLPLFKIEIVQNTKVFPLKFGIPSYLSEYDNYDVANVEIHTAWGKSILTTGDINSGSLYSYYEGECYELTDEFRGYLLNCDSNNNITRTEEIVVSPNFGQIFTLKGKKLLLSQGDPPEGGLAEDHWMLFQRDLGDDDEEPRPSFWCDNPKIEQLIAGRDYVSAGSSEEYGWTTNEGQNGPI